MKRNKTIAAVLAAVMLSLSLGACASVNEAATDRMDMGMNMDMNPAESEPSYSYGGWDDGLADKEYAPETSQSQSSTPNKGTPQADSARKLIKNVSMDLETLEFDAFLEQLYARVASAGGYIQSSSVDGGRYHSKGYYSRYASLTARIPADQLDRFCDGVAGISNVISRRENANDVTLEYYDTESHMKALQTEYETLVGILEKCTKLEDVITVQQRITTVLYQIESYKTTLNNYDNLVSYGTVTMTVQEVKEETVVVEQTVGERIAAGFSGTMRDLKEDSENLLVDFVANLPYLLIWAAVIAAVVIGIRSCIRRARKKRAAKAASVQKTPVDTNGVK